MITIVRNINCGELYAFVCESFIDGNKEKEYLVGKEGRFLNIEIEIRQVEKKWKCDPYLIIYQDDKEIGALWEEGGYIYINGQQFKCFLIKQDGIFILKVNMFDDEDTLYYKERVKKEKLMDEDRYIK